MGLGTLGRGNMSEAAEDVWLLCHHTEGLKVSRWLREEESHTHAWSRWPPKVWKKEGWNINFLRRGNAGRDESLRTWNSHLFCNYFSLAT